MSEAIVSSHGFIEPQPDLITPNEGGADDPLGESVLDPRQPWLRIFEPRDVRVVIGRHQDAARECQIAVCQAERIPVHRRVAGGGTVVLAPGMVVVCARLRHTQVGTSCYFAMMNEALIPGVAAVADQAPQCRGYGDLTMANGAADEELRRKFLGASLRQTSRMVVYMGVMLVADAVPLMERYLAFPSREPDYRGGRGHRDFCTSLDQHGVSVAALMAALSASCHQHLADQALH
jgi:lipoate-protein ligase A